MENSHYLKEGVAGEVEDIMEEVEVIMEEVEEIGK